ncbi:MAG: ribosome silencing factor [Candidatus Omnitrophica bacterium CG_4_9_14_0_2_um_filter_42_8]|nr:MAG: ribosome silencing factor [Candidatus Omnitrophica bacterium CG22_combo_CG10-13_8_21_14_all_43_16]PJC47248.1 MAG: ribosome silencing factor [Candidatus Omnitrophica bacterium CG_4_9_14_0_2_um_filter_42_8]
MRSKEKALLVAELAKQKLAEDVVILDMRKVSSITNFFVIASASSTKRCQTIAETIETGLSEKKESVSKIEGYNEGLWVLIDAYDVVAHVFYGDIRKFYNLEGLWGDAPRIKLCHKKKKTRSKKTSGKK